MAMCRVGLLGSRLRHPFRILCRQMSTEPRVAVDRLRQSGLLRTQGLIGGKWIDAYDGKTIPVHNPATGDVIANVPFMGRNEAINAISSAHETFTSWSKLTANERSKRLRKWYR
ncbi:succinate-semialdehyde dehydrogenase, mitochondrial-like [Curcuma longa]|uniref:succinate-semialdehyde dehydrogenase, mitochondrial-like n=1 Tax=Curcuma longa TaxID=136217 RepID=UPI003D9EB23F